MKGRLFMNGKEYASVQEALADLPRLNDGERDALENQYSVMPGLVDDEVIERRDLRRMWDEIAADDAGVPMYGEI